MSTSRRTALIGRMARFGLTGAVNTGVYYGLYRALCLVGPYMLAHVLGFFGAMVVSYFLNCSFTFRVRPSWRTFLLFPLSNATNFCAQTLGLYLLVDAFGVDEGYAPLPAAAAAIPVTFLVAQTVMADRPAASTAEPERAAELAESRRG